VSRRLIVLRTGKIDNVYLRSGDQGFRGVDGVLKLGANLFGDGIVAQIAARAGWPDRRSAIGRADDGAELCGPPNQGSARRLPVAARWPSPGATRKATGPSGPCSRARSASTSLVSRRDHTCRGGGHWRARDQWKKRSRMVESSGGRPWELAIAVNSKPAPSEEFSRSSRAHS